MEDFLIREIDRLGEMLMLLAKKLGLFLEDIPHFSVDDVKEELGKAGCPINLDTLLQQDNPVLYLVEQEKLSDQGLETMIDILFHTDLDEPRKQVLLEEALAYLDSKGYFSFKLHALKG